MTMSRFSPGTIVQSKSNPRREMKVVDGVLLPSGGIACSAPVEGSAGRALYECRPDNLETIEEVVTREQEEFDRRLMEALQRFWRRQAGVSGHLERHTFEPHGFHRLVCKRCCRGASEHAPGDSLADRSPLRPDQDLAARQARACSRITAALAEAGLTKEQASQLLEAIRKEML